MIRPATPADAEAIASIYSPYVTGSTATFEEAPPDAAEIGRRMLLEPRLPWFIADDGHGFAYASQHRIRAAYRWSVDVSVYLAAAIHGHGTGKALYGQLLPALRSLGYLTAFAGIALPNPASVGLHERFGFTPIGVFAATGFKHGRWIDVGWWQLPLQPYPEAPSAPLRWRG